MVHVSGRAAGGLNGTLFTPKVTKIGQNVRDEMTRRRRESVGWDSGLLFPVLVRTRQPDLRPIFVVPLLALPRKEGRSPLEPIRSLNTTAELPTCGPLLKL